MSTDLTRVASSIRRYRARFERPGNCIPEGMHQWDDQVHNALREQARRLNKQIRPGLSHALIFFTAGEAVRRVIPNHERYANKFGVWQRGLIRERDALEEIWKPYLDGRGTRDEGFAELIKRLADEAGK